MSYYTAINCLHERKCLREVQEKQHIQDGQHFDAMDCRRQISDLEAGIQALRALIPADAPGCPTTRRQETRANALPEAPGLDCNQPRAVAEVFKQCSRNFKSWAACVGIGSLPGLSFDLEMAGMPGCLE